MKRLLVATTLLAGCALGVACGNDEPVPGPEPTSTTRFSYDLKTFDLPFVQGRDAVRRGGRHE